MPDHHCFRGTTEQLHMPQHLRLAQAAQHGRQVAHDRLQGLYQHRAVVDGNDVLAGLGAETDLQLTRLGVPAYRYPRPATVAEFRSAQGNSPLFGLHAGHPLQLLGEQALLERQLAVMG